MKIWPTWLPCVYLFFAISITSSSGDNSAKELIISATTPDFYLGATYDCRTDQLIPGLSPWNPESLSKISSRDIPSVSMQVLLDESASNKLKKLGLKGEFQVSVLSGLIEVTGSASYLKHTASSFHSLSFSLVYKSIARFDHLEMDQFTKTQYEGVFDDKDLATHVVSGIEYGADYVVTFTTFIENGETADDVKAKLSASFNKIPGVSISGDASIDIQASSTTSTRNIAVTCFGELTIPSAHSCPTNFSNLDAFVRAIGQCKPGECGLVPKKVYLYPLSLLSDKAGKLVQQLADDLVEYAVAVLGDLNDKLAYLKGIYSWNQVSTTMDPIKGQAKKVYEALDVIKLKVNNQVAQSLVDLRSGVTGSSTTLSNILTNLERYLEFSNLDTWSSTVGTFLNQLGTEMSAIETEIDGQKSEYAMAVDGRDSWLVLWINLDTSYFKEFKTATDAYSPSIDSESFPPLKIEPWKWTDQTEAGKAIKLFRELVEINTELSSNNGFNVVANSSENPEKVAQLAVFSQGRYKFINPTKPVIISFNNSQYVENLTWNSVEDAYGYIVKLAKSSENTTTLSLTTFDTFIEIPDRYSRCSDCSVQICALYSKTMCGPWSESTEIPRFSSPYLEVISRKTACKTLFTNGFGFDTSLLTNSAFEISCGYSGGVTALTSWHLTHETCIDPVFQFDYSCGKLDPNVVPPSSNCFADHTTCQAYNRGSIADLSVHNVVCPDSSVLKGWKLNTDDCSSGEIRIDYQCCPVINALCNIAETNCAELHTVNFLDRQFVECPKGRLMQSFQLQLCDSKNANFRLSCCGVTG
jgi:hypothetical protein